MPNTDNNQHIFMNINARWFVPRANYFDLESLILPVSGAEPEPDKSNTQIKEKHQNCGYGLAVVDIGKPEMNEFEMTRGPDCLESLQQNKNITMLAKC